MDITCMLQACSNNSRKFLSKKGEEKNLVIHNCSQLISRPHQVHQHTIIFFKSMTSKQHKSTTCKNPSPMHHPAKNKWTFDHAPST